MSVGYTAVHWTRAKLVYDGVLLGAVATFLAVFWSIGAVTQPPQSQPEWIDLRIRAFGCCAMTMLTVILAIGPLARLDRRLLPLLANRRHLGVATFCIAVLHVAFMVEWYMAREELANLLPELTDWPAFGRFIGFPFKVLGLGALVILFLMATTSHDFWLGFLGKRAWKLLHMAVYVAYGLVIMHVALGPMQWDRSPMIPAFLAGALALIAGLHLVAGGREVEREDGTVADLSGWIVVGPPASIPDKGARIVTPAGAERIAVFRDGPDIGAVTNVCAHQMGPLGEGRIIDGCITCPWHGYQYRLKDGCAPPPFTEKLATYRLRLVGGNVEVHPDPLPPGTPASITWSPASSS